MLTMPSFQKSLIVEQFQGNYLNVQSKAFSLVGVKIWNGIPTSLKNVSRNCFKKTTCIRTKLIEILETETLMQI